MSDSDLAEKVEHIDNKVDELTSQTTALTVAMTRLVEEVIPEQKELRKTQSAQAVEINTNKTQIENLKQSQLTQRNLYVSLVVTVIGMGLGFLFGGG